MPYDFDSDPWFQWAREQFKNDPFFTEAQQRRDNDPFFIKARQRRANKLPPIQQEANFIDSKLKELTEKMPQLIDPAKSWSKQHKTALYKFLIALREYIL